MATANNSILRATSPARQSLRRWHNLCGLGVALVLIVTAFSGSVLVYKKPLIHWLAAPSAEWSPDYNVAHVAQDLDSGSLETAGVAEPTISESRRL